jgi:hypothetical protein
VIEWTCDAAREDADDQQYDARAGVFFLRVEEHSYGDGYRTDWWVTTADIGFANPLTDLRIVVASGRARSIYYAKQAARRALVRILDEARSTINRKRRKGAAHDAQVR